MAENNIRIKVGDIPEEEMETRLETIAGRIKGQYDGVTLREFIAASEMDPDESLAALYEKMRYENLKWPFRMLNVTIEVTQTCGYEIPVLGDEEIELYAKAEVDLEDLDPSFDLEEAYNEITAEDYGATCDYAVEDDTGRILVPWDD